MSAANKCLYECTHCKRCRFVLWKSIFWDAICVLLHSEKPCIGKTATESVFGCGLVILCSQAFSLTPYYYIPGQQHAFGHGKGRGKAWCLQYVKHWKMRDIKETVGITAPVGQTAACLLRAFGTKQRKPAFTDRFMVVPCTPSKRQSQSCPARLWNCHIDGWEAETCG